MTLSLLVGTNPQRFSQGAIVRLQAGRWILQSDGVRDSSLFLTLLSNGETISIQHDAEFVLEKSEHVQVDFCFRGQEKSITINVKKVA